MRDDTRKWILERRSAFVAAAASIGAAMVGVACDSRVCLSMVAECEREREAGSELSITGPTRMCVGDQVDLALIYHGVCDETSDVTGDAAFISTDPTIVAFDSPQSRTARAVGVGQVTITGRFADGSGSLATLVIEVEACADATSDAAEDSSPGD
jgi:hypothetical protein